MNGYANKKCAFTLVELLVVITIISILAGILLPVLGKAIGSARQTACISRMKQVGVAFRMYADDYRDYISAATVGTYVWGQYVGNYEYNGTLGAYAGWGARIYPYLGGKGSWRMFVCPSDPKVGTRDLTDRSSNGSQGTGASYTFNHGNGGSGGAGQVQYGGAPSDRWWRFSSCKWASKTCLVSQLKWESSAPAVWPYGYMYKPWSGTEYNPVHGNRINVLFCAGQVESLFAGDSRFTLSVNPFKAEHGEFWFVRW